tara:strand:- start:865 stop:1425 length:561 start_codon:yes stop_codon:yes gene_type:complete
MDISNAVGGSEIIFVSKLFSSLPQWSDFEDLFDKAHDKDGVLFQSFATMSIDKSETFTGAFDEMLSFAKNFHPGNPVAVLSIVHFQNSEDNVIGDEVVSIYNKFRSSNPQSLPSDFHPSMMVPTIHSDPVDGFYVQCTGTTLWTAYYEDEEKSWLTSPGDALFIPKGVQHSVKTLEPRAAISIGLV